MADVFISYASQDRESARNLARALEARGWSVWWDRKIVAGETFDQVIEHELESANCVIVLWSKASVTSEWVKNEAAAAAQRGVLVPALIDNVTLPLEFRRKHTANLIHWDGAASDEAFQSLCAGVAGKINPMDTARRESIAPPQRAFRWRRWSLAGAIAVAIACLVTVLIQVDVFRRTASGPPVADAGQIESSPTPTVLQLESQLNAANVKLSTGDDDSVARVRSYFTGPRSAYHLLAVHCIQILRARRLKETGYLDMIDKWYTSLVGEKNYVTASGGLDLEKLKEAIVRANNEYHGQSATSFEQVIQSIQ
jgi:hypothetical protein